MCVRVRKGIARTLALMLSVMMLLELLPGVAKAEVISVSGTFYQTDARNTLKQINAFRTGADAWYWNEDNATKTVFSGENALQPLTYDYNLEQIAMQRALEIAIYYDQNHYRPDGTICFTATYGGTQSYAENIAAGQSSAYNAFMAWREDDKDHSGQGHRRAMLSKDYTCVGIADVYVNGMHFHVQEFGCKNSNAAPSAGDGVASRNVNLTASALHLAGGFSGSIGCTLSYTGVIDLPTPILSLKTDKTYVSYLLQNTKLVGVQRIMQ